MADPICRWRNSSIKQLMEFNSLLPFKTVSKKEGREHVERLWKILGGEDFFTTPYQLAAQMGTYYEDDDSLYPRFDKPLSIDEAAIYMKKWGTEYYSPNPYSRSIKDVRPVVINKFLVNFAQTVLNPSFSGALREMFGDNVIGNTDILKNMLNNFSEVNIKDDFVTVKKVAEGKLYSEEEIYPSVDADDKKAFFDHFGGTIGSKPIVSFALPLQQIYYGAPGTGKSHEINEQTKGQDVIRTTFHPDSDYSTFVGAYKPTMGLLPICDELGQPMKIGSTVLHKEQIIYEFVEQAFLQAYIKAWTFMAENAISPEPQYLIIEEINRGNCAQIFGDLFQLLDRNKWGFSDYPINADKDMKKQLKKAFDWLTIDDAQSINSQFKGRDVVTEVLSGDILLLPKNLFIWATMNTSDQSLFPIDSAFKRRWDWKYMPINNAKQDYKIECNKLRYDWWEFLDKVNTAINKVTSSEDKKLGYFFCKADGKAKKGDEDNTIISADRFVSKAVFYIWNDVLKDCEPSEAKFEYKPEGEEPQTLSLILYGEEGKQRELHFSDFFNPDGSVKTESVELLMDNLKIEGKEVEDGGSDDEGAATGGFLKVVFPDGHEICESKPTDTFVNSITYIARTTGYEAIAEIGITHDGLPILSKTIQSTHAVRIVGDNKEWRLLTGIRHPRKAEILQEISDQLDLGLEIIISDSSAKEMPERISDTNMPYRVTFPDGEVICNGSGWNTYVATLKKIGLSKALPYGEIFFRKNKTLPLIAKERIPDDGIYKYYEIEGYYVLSGTDSQHRLLKRMSKDLNLGLIIE